MNEVIGVIGVGAMGSGIAQIAAVAGDQVVLFDTVPGAAARAAGEIVKRVTSLVASGRLELEIRPEDLPLTVASSLTELRHARVVVEAVVEDLATKQRLFGELEEVLSPECILASNTSSISPTALASELRHPERVIGMHFFNPVPQMPLVEVILGLATSPETAQSITELATSWGKTVVRSTPTPGFIVNRIARPYYAEAWRLLEERAALPSVIDAVLTGACGFRMGPFALMDLIGHDVNEAVTRSVWTGFGYDPRFAPSMAQRELVLAGWIGRKAGRGVYSYPVDANGRSAAEGIGPAWEPFQSPPTVAIEHGISEFRTLLARADIETQRHDNYEGFLELSGGILLGRSTGQSASAAAAMIGRPVIIVDRTLDDATATGIAISASFACTEDGMNEAVGFLQAAGLQVFCIEDVPGLIATRTVAMIINFAFDALYHGVADADDIDTAMRLGTNYPLGPIEWGTLWTPELVTKILNSMAVECGDSRYRPSPLLQRQSFEHNLR